jgi:hypothetical protein
MRGQILDGTFVKKFLVYLVDYWCIQLILWNFGGFFNSLPQDATVMHVQG